MMKTAIKNRLSKDSIIYMVTRFLWQLYKKVIWGGVFGFIFNLVPINKRKIVVSNFNGRGYGDSPKAIVDSLIKKNSELDIVWLLDDENFDSAVLPKNVRRVRNGSLHGLYELATAKIWIDNTRKLFAPKKRKGQFYVQTWHCGIGLKKSEGDSVDVLPKSYIKIAKQDSKNIDLLTSSSRWESDFYRRAFWYDGKILERGIPRSDILVTPSKHADISKKVRIDLGVGDNKKIVLYAPTFRIDSDEDKADDISDLECYRLDTEKIKRTLSKRFGGNWICAVRLHPNIVAKASKLSLKNVIDCSKYPDVNELLIASDVVITDYSSLIFDFGYMKKPGFLFATDIKGYANLRGWLFNLHSLPFVLAESNDELAQNIKNYDEKVYRKTLIAFYNELGLNETGKSTEYVVNEILERINEKK